MALNPANTSRQYCNESNNHHVEVRHKNVQSPNISHASDLKEDGDGPSFALWPHPPTSYNPIVPSSADGTAPAITASSLSSFGTTPSSLFNQPFEDPAMEPSPFRPIEENTISTINLEKQKLNASPSSSSSPSPVILPNSSIVPIPNRAGASANFVHSPSSSSSDAYGSLPQFRPYQDRKWKGFYERLIQFKIRHGHCCVPYEYEADPTLTRWIRRQRHEYKKYDRYYDNKSTMTASRIQQLDDIGFVWDTQTAAWLEKLYELQNFKARYGHCNVPSTYKESPSLSAWVRGQRRQYKLYVSDARPSSSSSSTTMMYRIRLLESMGFVFEPRARMTAALAD